MNTNWRSLSTNARHQMLCLPNKHLFDVAAHAQVLVLSVPGPVHPAGAANGTLHGGDRALPHPASMQGIFPTPASQFVRDLVARLLHAGTAPLDRWALE